MIYVPRVGDKVAVRTATGDERLVRVAALGAGVVYVTTEANYRDARAAGKDPEPMLGFPTEDVREA